MAALRAISKAGGTARYCKARALQLVAATSSKLYSASAKIARIQACERRHRACSGQGTSRGATAQDLRVMARIKIRVAT
jgi:hypothetical protein